MRGILAATGAATVAAASIAAPTPYTLAANVLTVTGYTFGGKIDWEMDEIFRGSFCSEASGNSCTSVEYNSGVSEGAEEDGLRALRAAFGVTAPPTVVVGFSQGATIATHWLQQSAGSAGAPAPEDLSFVLAANPKRKYGGVRSGFAEPTPHTEYDVVDIAIEYDGAADFPTDPRNLLALANALAGFAYFHIPGYNNIDLETADKLVWKEGNTTYVLIRRENLPLLEPLRMLGLDELADALNAPLKEAIDAAYDRDYPGLIDPKWHDEVLGSIFASAEEDDDVEPASARFASAAVVEDAQDEPDTDKSDEAATASAALDDTTDDEHEDEASDTTADTAESAPEDDADEQDGIGPDAEAPDSETASEARKSTKPASSQAADTDTDTEGSSESDADSDSGSSAE
ncbi:PE-PPE domain-containing protein [Mycolicibacterium sp. BiH015]|uniref:PE-PPE domain-containing protein n=1 Tax=Mycolicibacterium sp. BiH015 TaxID=3018808 RepID=UPI0022E37AF1|nr:PE-PPE domain-containing protein [Mycolicibacterium sp. BiH015]MDA2890673.1 PE-PPE domain-containing protein [Mycolicibacterium sp. BiH015]